MGKSRKLVVVGDSAFAEIAYEYFTHDSEYQVVGFSVERKFLKKVELFGLPVVPFESLEKSFSPSDHEVFAAIAYAQLNRLRARFCAQTKEKGFKLASYVSSRAFVWRNVQMGEHCFVFEGNVVQPFVRLGNDVILWSGNHIGHHSIIRDHCFISSHVVISGFVEVGESCFLGVNSTVINNIKIAKDSWIGPGILITKDTSGGSFYKSSKVGPSAVTTYRYFNLAEQ